MHPRVLNVPISCSINPTLLSLGGLLGVLSGAVSLSTASGNLVGFRELYSQRSHLSDERRSSSVAGSFQNSALACDQLLILSPRGRGDEFDQFLGY